MRCNQRYGSHRDRDELEPGKSRNRRRIITAPNEQHLPIAREVAKAGKHVYTERPIASTLEEGLEIEALEQTGGVVYAALRSIEKQGQAVRIADVITEAHARVAERSRHVA